MNAERIRGFMPKEQKFNDLRFNLILKFIYFRMFLRAKRGRRDIKISLHGRNYLYSKAVLGFLKDSGFKGYSVGGSRVKFIGETELRAYNYFRISW